MSHIITDLIFKVMHMFGNTVMEVMHKESERAVKRLLQNEALRI